jgi:hypothetical protein
VRYRLRAVRDPAERRAMSKQLSELSRDAGQMSQPPSALCSLLDASQQSVLEMRDVSIEPMTRMRCVLPELAQFLERMMKLEEMTVRLVSELAVPTVFRCMTMVATLGRPAMARSAVNA